MTSSPKPTPSVAPCFGNKELSFENGTLKCGEKIYDITVELSGKTVVLAEKWDGLDQKIQTFAKKLFEELKQDSVSKDKKLDGAVLVGDTINGEKISDTKLVGLIRALGYSILQEFATEAAVKRGEELFNPLERENKLQNTEQTVTDRGLWHIMGPAGRTRLTSKGLETSSLGFALPSSSLAFAVKNAFQQDVISNLGKVPTKEGPKVAIFKEKIQTCQEEYNRERNTIRAIAELRKSGHSVEAERKRADYVQSLISSSQSLGKEDYQLNSWILPVSINAQGEVENHEVMSKIKKDNAGNFSVTIFNTGLGKRGNHSAATYHNLPQEQLRLFFEGMSYVHDPKMSFKDKKTELSRLGIDISAVHDDERSAVTILYNLLSGEAHYSQEWQDLGGNTCTWDVITEALKSEAPESFKKWEPLMQAKSLVDFTKTNLSLLFTSEYHREFIREGAEHIRTQMSALDDADAAKVKAMKYLEEAAETYLNYYASLTEEETLPPKEDIAAVFALGLCPKIKVESRKK